MRMLRSLFLYVMTCAFGVCVSAAELGPIGECAVSERDRAGRPEPLDEPTVVRLSIAVMDILKIDDLNQKIELDLMVYIGWTDPRLAPLSGCRVSDTAIWTPELQMLNSSDLKTQQAPQFRIGDNGVVEGRLRFQGSITSPRTMTNFPFDEHSIKIVVASVLPDRHLDIEVMEGKSLIRKELSIPDWTIEGMTTAARSIYFEQMDENHSVLELRLDAKRQAGYYWYKIILPLTMIVMMSWAVFWIDPNMLSPQMSLAGTSMLTLIAFQFSMSDLLPRFGYFTVLDWFILSSSVLVFFALVEAVTTGHLALHASLKLANRIDKFSRWMFPSVYCVAAIWILGFS